MTLSPSAMKIVASDHALSTRGLAIARTSAAVFEAIREHAKDYPDEAERLYGLHAAHLRAAVPWVLAALPDPLLEKGEL